MKNLRIALFGNLPSTTLIWLLLFGILDVRAESLIAPPALDTLTVFKGQSLLLEYDGLTRVSVGDGALIEVKVFAERNEVLLIAREAGKTDIRLWDSGRQPSRYLVEVRGEAGGLTITKHQLAELVSDLPEISTIEAAGEVLLKGQARNQFAYEHANALASRYANVVSYVQTPVFEKTPTVILQAKMLEVRTSALKDLGVEWNQFINGPVFGTLRDFKNNDLFRLTEAPDGTGVPNVISGSRNFGGISSSISSTINLLIENGDARVLAEPTLACISGGSADFLAGGEIPIPIRDENGVPSVEFKEFGIILKFAPLVDAQRNIRTDVQVEVSAVDQSISVLDVPGFLTRKSNTLMNLAEGQTMVIAGLVSRDDAKNVRKLPILGQTPILGELFKSRQFRRQKSELVILVTPKIIDATSPLNQAYQERYSELLENSDKDLGYQVRD